MDSNLSNILSAISVILVFLTIIFDILSKEVDVLVGKKKPLEKEGEYRKELQTAFRRSASNTVLHSIAFLMLTFLLFPTVFTILKNSSLNLWNFDVLNTLFVFIYIFVIIFSILSIRMTYKILKRKSEVFRR